jgi:hypothetical protein
LDLHSILSLFDQDRRTRCQDGEVLDSVSNISRLRAADGSYHLIISSSLAPETADAVIEREIDHHRAIGAGFEWKLYFHDRPTDLLDRLKRRGFEIGPREAVMILDLENRPPWVNDNLKVRVDRVETLQQVEIYRAVAEKVFEKDYRLTSSQLARAIQTGSTQHRGYIAFSDNEPVSIGRLYTHPGSPFAGLYGGGTLKEHRSRGFYRALVAVRARDAITSAARFLQVDALPTSQPILERMGFRILTHTWPCEWRPERE